MREYMIWNDNIDSLDGWGDFLEEEGLSAASEDEKWERVSELNASYRDDEVINLNRKLDGTVIAIGDIDGGRREQVFSVEDENLNSFLNVSCEKYWCDQYNVLGKGYDGTDYIFRLIPRGVDADCLINALDEGRATMSQVKRYTRSLRPYISKIYGWGGRQA